MIFFFFFFLFCKLFGSLFVCCRYSFESSHKGSPLCLLLLLLTRRPSFRKNNMSIVYIYILMIFWQSEFCLPQMNVVCQKRWTHSRPCRTCVQFITRHPYCLLLLFCFNSKQFEDYNCVKWYWANHCKDWDLTPPPRQWTFPNSHTQTAVGATIQANSKHNFESSLKWETALINLTILNKVLECISSLRSYRNCKFFLFTFYLSISRESNATQVSQPACLPCIWTNLYDHEWRT